MWGVLQTTSVSGRADGETRCQNGHDCDTQRLADSPTLLRFHAKLGISRALVVGRHGSGRGQRHDMDS